jgi:acetyl-CoA carboxylase carboxyl transferase subunit beta
MAVKNPKKKKNVPEGLWTKCPGCTQIIFNKDLKQNLKVCPKCAYHFPLSARERIDQLCPKKTFVELDHDMMAADPLNFHDLKKYKDRLRENIKKSGLNEAIITGIGDIGRHRVGLGVLDFSFMGGSMGSVVGEKISRMVEKAVSKRFPVVIIAVSGGARMQESILSLMQMAKTCAALAKLGENKLPYISVLANPTTGGVTASFAMMGDVNLAEPKALIGFAGPRVIEQTIRQQLPAGFQRAEFLLGHGMVDMVVERKNLKNTIDKLLDYLYKG